MTQEEKELLLKDLCARLPYGVKIKTPGRIYTIDAISNEGLLSVSNDDRTLDGLIPLGGPHWLPIMGDYKPYLRPMSSMTEEEREDLSDYLCERVMSDKKGITFPPDPIHGKGIPFEWMSECLDWLNTHHFDYRGLIPMGLALEAPEDMYKI